MFLVQSGTATFETEDGDVRVGAGEASRFAPGEWQRGHNEGDERVVALALGAPQEMDDTDSSGNARSVAVGREYVDMTANRDALVRRCADVTPRPVGSPDR